MRILLLLSLIFTILGCKKTGPAFDGQNCTSDCYILTGQVTDTPSTAGLKGVEVKFYYQNPNYSIFNPTTYLGSTLSDAGGNYSFRFNGTRYKTGNGIFYMLANKQGYLYYANSETTVRSFHLDSSLINIPLVQNFSLFRVANLIVRVRATNITNFNTVVFLYDYGLGRTGHLIRGGRTIDTTLTYQTAGDIRTFVQWEATGNGVNLSRKDTLFTTAGGNLQYEINL